MSLTAILILLATGISFGVWITLSTLRNLSERANKSAVCHEIVNKLIHYRSANYHLHFGGEVKSVAVKGESDDESLENALKQLGYKKDEILKATQHVSNFEGSLTDKIFEAVKFMGGKLT